MVSKSKLSTTFERQNHEQTVYHSGAVGTL
nr:MAG TPA: hypothetical protein [Inoviridae sp.]